MTVNNKNKSGGIVYYFCHKRDHLKKNWKKKQQHVNTAANNRFCLCAVNSNYYFAATDGYGKWITNSGAPCHICNDEKVFVNLNRSIRKPIVLANTDTVISSREGTIKIRLKANDQKFNNITFENVLFVPTVNTNILSVKRLTDKDCKIDFYKDKCVIRKDGETVFLAYIESGLYVYKIEDEVKFNVCKTNCIHHWHKTEWQYLKNRSLFEMVRYMLVESKLPNVLWGEAVSSANYLQNRIVTRTTGVTPFERFFLVKFQI